MFVGGVFLKSHSKLSIVARFRDTKQKIVEKVDLLFTFYARPNKDTLKI